ncbi:MAG: TolC family protein, partial [Verrucomicrobiota bacterium]
MKIAARRNADVLIQIEEEAIALQEWNAARSFRRPTIQTNAEQSYTDFSEPINPLTTPDHLHAGSYGVQLQQSLFNDFLRSNVRAARENVAAEQLNSRSQELDAMEAAGLAFLDYLAARSLWQIQKENLRITENNLQLAKLRVQIGSVEDSETYRWEQSAASSRATLFQARADQDNARIELNRVLGQPREKSWQFEDITLSDQDTYFMDNILLSYLRVETDLFQFASFLQHVAVPASPELASFDYGLAAQGILLAQIERSFFLPELAAVLSYDRTGQGTEVLDFATQGEALAALSFQFPLYEGGLRKAEAAEQRAVIRQLSAQRERTVQIIEQRALTSMNGISSEHPNIRLSRRALEAAEKNFESVRTKYSAGASTILDLLDAQSTLLQERQSASLAVYAYLQEIIRMQRSIAWFEHEKSSFEKDQWIRMFDQFMRGNGLIVPATVAPDQEGAEAQEKARIALEKAVEQKEEHATLPPEPTSVATPE